MKTTQKWRWHKKKDHPKVKMFSKIKTPQKWSRPKNEDELNNEDNLKNKDNFENEDDIVCGYFYGWTFLSKHFHISHGIFSFAVLIILEPTTSEITVLSS